MNHNVSVYPFKNFTTQHSIYLTELETHIKPSRQEIVDVIVDNLETSALDNVYAHSTDWRLDLKSDIISTVVESMKQALSEIMLEYQDKRNPDFAVSPIFTFNLLNCWGVIYKEGDSTKNHWHFPCTMSQVYFVNVESNSSPLCFSDLDVAITPESGMLITFPSYLKHYVPPLEKNDQRIIISTNWLFGESNDTSN